MDFILHPSLARKIVVTNLPLCCVLLNNDRCYPWLMLVPRRPNISRIMELQPQDQLQLLQELDWAQKILWELFQPKQLNVAAIGNKISQLHLHIVARQTDDPAWPDTVWDHPVRKEYSKEEKKAITHLLEAAFEELLLAKQVSL